MKQFFIAAVFLMISFLVQSQDTTIKSIHQQELVFHQLMGAPQSADSFDASQKSIHHKKYPQPLQKRVFGYHPYWGGNNYLNYQWGLLSDLCYFSYEVDPATGLPLTTHDWADSPAIDSALAHGTHVHLCVTLFSGHALFFNNPDAQQTLIDEIILLIQQRNAQGVNIDLEALPSSYSAAFTSFMIDLSTQMDSLIPEAEVSIAAPAVNWSNKFDIPVLNQYIDFFMVMGYDYYWPGSSQAGASSPIYPMVGSYTYCFSRSISYYQSLGVSNAKIVMGVPYYAYQWPTQTGVAPSYTTGNGNAYTYSTIHNNGSGNYSAENKHREPNSLSAYYAFNNGGWVQCFIEDTYSLREKYQTVNRRNLGGIGIWALGYDDGYSELWDLIGENFTGDGGMVSGDTLFDSGGPAFNYFDDEGYTYTFSTSENNALFLKFIQLNLEQGYDTLWVFDGSDVNAPLLAVFSGDSLPPLIQASSNVLTLRFYSDVATTDAGWMAVYDTTAISSTDFSLKVSETSWSAFPNPFHDQISFHSEKKADSPMVLNIYDGSGKLMESVVFIADRSQFILRTTSWKPGWYIAEIKQNDKTLSRFKLMKQ